METLADSLRLVLPALDPALASPRALRRIVPLAEALPPIHLAGFECRLDAEEGQVDFQQGVRNRAGDPALLAEFIESHSRPGPAWSRVARLCREWSAPGSSLAQALREIWLEFDVPGERADAAQGLEGITPSVFARLGPGGSGLAPAVLEQLSQGPHSPALQHALSRCAAACPTEAHVSHVALMLGRDPAGLRLNISGLSLSRLPGFLKQLDWPGSTTEIQRLAGVLLEFVDTITFGLDLGPLLQPRIGLECFFTEWHTVDPRWPFLLDHLVAAGICRPEKRDALLRWPGRLTPPEVADPWPERLLVRGLLASPDRLGVIDRRLSHVKFVHDPGAPLRAKAYLGFEHLWMTTSGRPENDARNPEDAGAAAVPQPRRKRPTRQLPRAALDRAIRRATSFLLGTRNQAGMWRDFYTRARPGASSRFMAASSDEWVTAYVGWALLAGGDRRGRAAARQAWKLLCSRGSVQDGWGYNAQWPEDADSTAWALRLAQALGVRESNRMANARAFLLGHLGPGGGVACYRLNDTERLQRASLQPGPFDGWCAPHASISAAAATLDLGPKPVEYLLEQQRQDGSWTDYWWDDDEVVTARAVEALLADGRPESRAAAQRAVAWAAARVANGNAPSSADHPNDSAFALALCLEMLARGSAFSQSSLPLRHAFERLVSLQRADGSFPPSARLRAPDPKTFTIEASGAATLRSPDHDAIYTTATALLAFGTVHSLAVNRLGEA